MSSGNAKGLVLVVDDEPTNIEILASLLEEECEVIFATSGQRAIELALASQPDLILLDVLMPGLDGFAVFTILKTNPNTAGIPVIFVTGRNDDKAEAHGLELGAADYISKPINPPVVRVRVRNQLELKRARDELERLASTDGLTGLPNRRKFDQVLHLEFLRVSRTGGWLSIILLDIDHFKLFNDHYGHIAGDDCLRRVGATLGTRTKRAADLVARYGGEEFTVILPETDLQGAVRVAENLRQSVEGLAIPHIRSAISNCVTASFGVAARKWAAGETPLSILTQADLQLYAAKAAGRNCIMASGME